MDKFLSLFSSKKQVKKRYENCTITTPINIEYHNNNEFKSLNTETITNVENIIMPEIDYHSTSKEEEKVVLQQPIIKDEVVVVNNYDRSKKAESVYSLKYSQKINSLKMSNPIMIERDNMKINFDIEVIDYLLSDMMLIFKEKIKTLDVNQNSIFQGFNESRELINLLNEMYNDSTMNYNIESARKLNKIFNDIDGLESIINSLSSEVDALIDQADQIENSID